MKSALIVLTALAITGCADMTPMQKKVLTATAAILVSGAIVAHNGGKQSPAPEALNAPAGPPCHPQPDGSCR